MPDGSLLAGVAVLGDDRMDDDVAQFAALLGVTAQLSFVPVAGFLRNAD